ncbi:MAG: bifunctional riboflavin kinase/FAD synthetase [Alysiella sp.]|uniref:bifunctional riboflavin kinase/FAD synthetase n=1 Tax=Alysiella sp. TaxID=1872483 RepID=UPI0026DD7C63|nr:bifunctional riboflavin kinase/FAD synthetase [Alysiella sp.]MDO4434719.1 bifunctional riboflavin kinase/FAD synthetase [Alysiella sp.]
MNIWFGRNAPHSLQGSAVSIGNFDGVHIGHKRILQRLHDEARARGLQSVVLVFEPQPTEYFAAQSGRTSPFRLTPMRDKLRLLAQTDCVDAVWIQRFNTDFASLSAQDFMTQILLDKLNTRFLLVGDDFRFGKGRTGDFEFLLQQTEFETQNTPSILVSGSRASSTRVREALAAGRLDVARQILGHDYRLSGKVKHGAKLGRVLGCPTANVHLASHRYALSGVFVIEVTGSFGRKNGVANLGYNPTVSMVCQNKLEVHLFDFSGSLYGERIEVTFLHKLRNEMKFNTLSDLQNAIAHDMNAARNWLSNI